MEFHKAKSIDSILSLHCEEVFSENSSLDTLILNNDEKPKKNHRHYKSKNEHRSRRVDQKKIKYSDSGRAFVTQEIHVERQDFQCIINLNTTICDHGNGHRRSCDVKSTKDLPYKRIVPNCLRSLCRQPRQRRTNTKMKEHCAADLNHRVRLPNKAHEYKKELKHKNYRTRYPRHEQKSKEKLILKLNEPQTKVPKQLEPEYEDISTTSFHSDFDVPTSYKCVRNDVVEYQESKLDTLIKRTKERERRLVQQSRKLPCYTSTPAYTEASSEFPMSCSEIDMSLPSRSTLILEPRDDQGYSPSIGLCQTFSEKYSPSSPIENFLLQSDLEFKIKSEPDMDIEAYSPTQNYDLPELIKEQWIKKEVKIEKTNHKS